MKEDEARCPFFRDRSSSDSAALAMGTSGSKTKGVQHHKLHSRILPARTLHSAPCILPPSTQQSAPSILPSNPGPPLEAVNKQPINVTVSSLDAPISDWNDRVNIHKSITGDSIYIDAVSSDVGDDRSSYKDVDVANHLHSCRCDDGNDNNNDNENNVLLTSDGIDINGDEADNCSLKDVLELFDHVQHSETNLEDVESTKLNGTATVSNFQYGYAAIPALPQHQHKIINKLIKTNDNCNCNCKPVQLCVENSKNSVSTLRNDSEKGADVHSTSLTNEQEAKVRATTLQNSTLNHSKQILEYLDLEIPTACVIEEEPGYKSLSATTKSVSLKEKSPKLYCCLTYFLSTDVDEHHLFGENNHGRHDSSH